MENAAAIVASFYWQFTGVLNQDVPLDERGEPTEFARYVRYFVERKPRFQGDLADALQQMTVATYLEALQAGRETRAYIRRASYAANEISRRSKPLAGISLTFGSECKVRDIVEASLLDHGLPLLTKLLAKCPHLDEAAEKPQLVFRNLQCDAPVDVATRQDLREWAAALERFRGSFEHGQASDASFRFQELKSASIRLIRLDPRNSWTTRILDRVEAVLDASSAWLGLAKSDPAEAVRQVIREMRALPRLVPSGALLFANCALFMWIVGRALAEIETGWAILALIPSVLASQWVADAVTYAVHLERDGWGNSTVAKAFQDHHDVPDEVGLWTVRRSVGTTGVMVLIPMLLLALGDVSPALAIGAACCLIGILFATQTHRWAHAAPDRIPWWVVILQKIHVMIPIEAHAIHHDNLNRSWGIFNGWSNYLLDRFAYHEKYTRLRARFFGDVPPLWESQLEARSRLVEQRAERMTTRSPIPVPARLIRAADRKCD